MFNKNVFTQKDPIADIIKGINEADYKAKMEELKGNQHKIDKNKNNKIDAHDFKILRGEKKTMKEEEEVEESNNPFDLKNYKSQLPTKPGEKAGFDSKKVSTGTIYSRKPVKDEPMKKEEIDPNDTTTDTLKGREKTSANPFLSKKVKMDVPDNVKEDVEQIDELKKSTVKSYMNKKVDRIHKDADLQYPFKPIPITKKEVEKNTKDLMRGHARLSGVKPTSEEVEQIDELSKDTLKSYSSKAKKDSEEYKKAGYAYDSDPDERAFAPKAFKKAASRAAGAAKADSKIKEDVEQVDEANIQPTSAKSRTHIGNLSNPVVNSVVHPSSGKEIGLVTKQPNGTYHAHHSAAKPAHSESGTFDTKDKAHQFIRNAHAKAIKNGTLSDRFLKSKPLPHLAKEETELDERTLTKGETAEKERIVKGMKKSLAGFKTRYGDKAKSVMYATATKAAKKD
jgi:hypothetical protein